MSNNRTAYPHGAVQTVLDAERNILYAIAMGRTGRKNDLRTNSYLTDLVAIDTNTLSVIDSARVSVPSGYNDAITSLHFLDRAKQRLIIGSIATFGTSVFDISGREVREIATRQGDFYRAMYYPAVGRLSGTKERFNAVSAYNVIDVRDGSANVSEYKCGI